MAEEILNSVSNLRIDDEEEQVIDIVSLNPNNENNVSLLLIGKLLTERSYNIDAFKRTITTVWAPQHGLVIRTLKPNLFAFQFYHWRDMSKVMDGRPWCFDNMLVLLKEADGDEQPDQVCLNHSPFWIRLKNLPFNMRSNDVVKALIGNLGEILDIEEDVLGIGRYRRVKVLLDVSKPLRRYRKLRDKSGKDLQVDFAYERLPFFCLACGIMGHAEKDCQFVLDEDKCEKLGWNLSLKATPRKGRNKEMEEELKFKHCKKNLFDKPSELVKQGSLLIKEHVISPDTNPIKAINSPQFSNNGGNLMAAASAVSISTIPQKTCSPAPQLVDPPVCDTPPTPTFCPHSQIVPPFVFTSIKEPIVSKHKAWKRLARGPMIDKGDVSFMEMDHDLITTKRPHDSDFDGELIADTTVKRLKLSVSHDVAPVFPAEVGDDQPRQAL
uniref:CCHC-type domain-containing protein n=1 Tax=Beta vulgaris subsp. vulgaris TaxID=3555 RepID=F4NCI9_BETVV|nr:hypothetical protein [Beta vulgaris subsp. vulgaris]